VAGLLVFALHYDGAINKNSLGAVFGSRAALHRARDGVPCARRREAIADDVAASLGRYGATKVFASRRPKGLPSRSSTRWSAVRFRRLRLRLFGGGLLGFEVGAGLAARLDAGVTMEVTAVNVVDGKLEAERPILGDSSISTRAIAIAGS